MERTFLRLAAVALLGLSLGGCYVMRPSSGGGQTEFTPPRQLNPGHIAVPAGFTVEAVARDLTFPTAVVTDEANRVYVVEAGYSYGEKWTTPRLLRIGNDGSATPVAVGERGPWTGASYHDGFFYIAESSSTGGRILKIDRSGKVDVLLDGLPPAADHHTNRPVVGPDGYVYFGQGTATNSGVVGEDNAKMGWLKRDPSGHDIPCRDTALAGVNFESKHVLAPEKGTVKTGAFVPFGRETRAGEVIPGRVPCSGAILRVARTGGKAELVAWGLRNPFGLTFAPDGALYVSENGYDERGSRPVFGSADFLWKIESGAWYGWPDFVGGRPITQSDFKPPAKPEHRFVMAKHPGTPKQPSALLGVHSSSSGLDISRNAAFGYSGQAFVAQFGDIAKESGKVLHPVGFKVVRVDLTNGVVEDFMTNRGEHNAPASRHKKGAQGSAGLERPVDVRFDNSGTQLYVVDFGVMTVGKSGIKPHENTGVLWRISRADPSSTSRGDKP